MSRKPTPVNVLDELLPAQSETTVIRQSLRWDYSQAGDAADAVRSHAIEIKRHERRANESVIEAGRHLVAVKDSLSHGQWSDWLATEFSMTDRTAQTLMNIADRFDGKSEIISDLSSTVLGLLAAPSVPDAAIDAVVEASAHGKVTVADAKQIIAEHKPQPVRPFVEPALNEPWDPWLRAYRSFGPTGLAHEIVGWAQDWTDNKGRTWEDVAIRNPQHANSPFYQDLAAECKRRGVMLAPHQLPMVISNLFALLSKAVPSVDAEESNGYATQSQIETWLKEIEGPAAELRDAAENLDGPLYKRLSVRAWRDRYELSPVTTAAALRNTATDREYEARKAGYDAVQRSQAAVAEYHASQPAADNADWKELKVVKMSRLMSIYKLAIGTFDEYGQLTGAYTETSQAKRELERLIAHLERECALLEGRTPVAGWAE